VVLDEDPAGRAQPPCAAVFGRPEQGCLVRIHSRCLYGEVFGSEDCDCQAQLEKSKSLIRDAGSGVLIYLDQEGRGAGLCAKARAYALADERGTDSFTSYEWMGLPVDSRSYDGAVELLRRLDLRRVALLTDNRGKIDAVQAAGIEVEHRSLKIAELRGRAREYVMAKERRFAQGHPPSNQAH
jgi:GTP cyclohydrolase II